MNASASCLYATALQELARPFSIVITADTYTSVLPQVQRCCAEAIAAGRTQKPPREDGRRSGHGVGGDDH
jgi:hypothetical protein